MALRPPCELVSRRMLPSIRGLVAQELSARGYSQNRIAKILGVTQAAVNYYLSIDRRKMIEDLEALGLRERQVETMVRSIVDYVVRGSMYSALTLVCSQCMQLRSSRALCSAHVREVQALEGCNVCPSLIGGVEVKALEVLENLKLAAAILEHSRHFVHVIPEVNSNIVMAKSGASGISDVAAIPGRIVRAVERARAVSEPRFGASKHLARVLLAAARREPRFRAAINLKFDDRMKEALKTLGIKYVMVRDKPRSRYVSEDEIVDEIVEAISRQREVPEAIVDPGGVGYEPALYLFGEDAVDVAQKAIGLASAYLTVASNQASRR